MSSAMSDGSTYTNRDAPLRAREEWRSTRPEYVVPDRLRIPADYDGHEKGGYCTEAIVAAMEARILKGASLESAKASEFIPRSTWKTWRANAERGEEPYRTMWERLHFARKHYEGRKLGVIDDVSECEDPAVALRGAKQALEYANPARYAPQTRQKLDITHSGTVQTVNLQVLAGVTPADLSKLLEARLGRGQSVLTGAEMFETPALTAPTAPESGDADE